MAMHPNQHPRVVYGKAARGKPAVRVVVYAPVSSRAAWIEKELTGDDFVMQVCRSVRDVIAALVDDPVPRPQVLVVDFDALDAGEVLELHSARDRGWCGTIFAVGRVPMTLRRSLHIEQVLGVLVDNALRLAVADVGFDAATRRVPVLPF